MSAVAVVEGLAWLISAVLAGWMLQDLVRVARRNDAQALVDAPDPLEESPAEAVPTTGTPTPGTPGQAPGRTS
jgi:hypothetical protein